MTSNDYKFYQQVDFRGGVQTEPENAKPNQVLDARNYWTTRARPEVRPGVGARLFQDPNLTPIRVGGITVNPVLSESILAAYLQGSAGVITPLSTSLPDLSFPVNTSAGNSIIFTFAGSGNRVPNAAFSLQLSVSSTYINLVPVNYAFEVLTSRGWLGVEFLGPQPPAALFGTPLVTSDSIFTFSPPTDTIPANQGGLGLSGAGLAVRLRITSGTMTNPTGVRQAEAFDTGCYYYDFSVQQPVFAGAYRLQYGSGVKYLAISLAGPSQLGASKAPPYTIYSERDRLQYESQFPESLLNGNFSFFFNSAPGFSAPPPTVAIIPEFNTAYSAYQNTVVEHPLNPPYPPYTAGANNAYGIYTTSNPYGSLNVPNSYAGSPTNYYKANVAQVNSDPLLVGATSISAITTSIYPVDQIPQLNTFPQANLIFYLKNTLWAAGLLGEPQTIRWSANASYGAYNVWPAVSQVTLSTASDNTEITALAALGDNLVVFKKNSIWLMVLNGTDDNNLVQFEPQLVVPGVGCLAHNSVKAIPGGLMFLAEDGFYLFDGTPNIKRLSDPVKDYIQRINPGRAPFAQAVNWRTKQYYLCAVSLDGEDTSNSFVFAYDYQLGAWWVWDGWDVQCWLQEEGVGIKEELWFLDNFGRAYKLGWGQTDNGTAIESYLTTQRFGQNEVVTKKFREIRLLGVNSGVTVSPVSYDVITDDITTVSEESLTMALEDEALWSDPPVSGVSEWVPERRRERKSPILQTAKWVQVVIRNAAQIIMTAIGYDNESRR